MRKFTFGKEEKLKKEKLIQELFKKGSSFYLFPFKTLVLPSPVADAKAHQVLISVSRKNFKKAVDRNLIKRRIREAYRLQKEILPASPKILLGLIYTHKEILTFEELRKRVNHLLHKISNITA